MKRIHFVLFARKGMPEAHAQPATPGPVLLPLKSGRAAASNLASRGSFHRTNGRECLHGSLLRISVQFPHRLSMGTGRGKG